MHATPMPGRESVATNIAQPFLAFEFLSAEVQREFAYGPKYWNKNANLIVLQRSIIRFAGYK